MLAVGSYMGRHRPVLTKTPLPGEVAVSCGYAHSLDEIMGV